MKPTVLRDYTRQLHSKYRNTSGNLIINSTSLLNKQYCPIGRTAMTNCSY